jgi:hypothetical protein
VKKDADDTDDADSSNDDLVKTVAQKNVTTLDFSATVLTKSSLDESASSVSSASFFTVGSPRLPNA